MTVSSSDSGGRPVRVLCLHGTCSSGAAMRKQISRLKAVGKSEVELICIDGPMLAEEDNPQRAEQERFFKGMEFYDFARIMWDDQEDQTEAKKVMEGFKARFPEQTDYLWHMAGHPEDRLAVSVPRRYVDVEAALEYLQGQLLAHAPIDGILGFSQGANFASLLAAQAEMGEGAKFSFVVHLCPARPGWPKQLPELFEKPLTMRSLHISGNSDFLNPPLCLRHLYEAPTCLLHNDSHRPMPGTSSEEANRIARAIVDFILNQPVTDALSQEDIAAISPGPAAGARELTVEVTHRRGDEDIKSEMVVKCGTSVWDLKELISKADPTGAKQPDNFDLVLPDGEELDDLAIITADDKELEIKIF